MTAKAPVLDALSAGYPPDPASQVEGVPPALDLAAVLAAITDLTSEVRTLKSEVDAVKTATPRFEAMRPPVTHQPLSGRALQAEQMGGLRAGQKGGGTLGQVPVGPRGLRLAEGSYQRQSFWQGQTVQLNRAAIHDWDEGEGGRTWESLLVHARTGETLQIRCQTELGPKVRCGAVVRVGDVCASCRTGPSIAKLHALVEERGWSYLVVVPGLTQPWGQVLYEDELLAAGAA